MTGYDESSRFTPRLVLPPSTQQAPQRPEERVETNKRGSGEERRKIRIMPMVGRDYHDTDHSLRSAPHAVAVPGSGEAERGGNEKLN